MSKTLEELTNEIGSKKARLQIMAWINQNRNLFTNTEITWDNICAKLERESGIILCRTTLRTLCARVGVYKKSMRGIGGFGQGPAHHARVDSFKNQLAVVAWLEKNKSLLESEYRIWKDWNEQMRTDIGIHVDPAVMSAAAQALGINKPSKRASESDLLKHETDDDESQSELLAGKVSELESKIRAMEEKLEKLAPLYA